MLKKNNKKIIILMSILSIMSLVYLISAEPSFPEPLSQLNPGDSIQDAINSSSPGDIIELNDGVYNSDGDYDINVTVDSLTIKAVDGANPIINATGKNKRVFMINSNNVTLDGLTITGGNNTQSSNDGRAGGVYSNANNTTISNCNITQNFASAGSGGGIYFSLRNGNNNVIGCNIIGNTATSGSGGGVNIDTGNVIDCNITGNTAINNAGGGAYIVYGNMIGCNITNNKANSPGGGVYIYSGNVSACNIINNIATGSAGGVNIGNSGNISYNRICNNNASNGANLYTTSNNVVYDYNWWGTNNISLAGLSSPADPDTYFVIQLSVNDSWTRTNTTEKFGDNLSLNYTMVLNSTNNS
ncbi:MAG: hypothetical protein LBT10_03565, partial [Methanobrevibacter sp.]|nr:hypothetical protein [Methanobrevibacter sp.]